MNVLAVMDARSAHDQLSRVKKAACTSLETLKEVKNMIPRRYQKELTRIKTCMDAQAIKHSLSLSLSSEQHAIECLPIWGVVLALRV